MILVENMLTPITTKKERKLFEYNMDFFLFSKGDLHCRKMQTLHQNEKDYVRVTCTD